MNSNKVNQTQIDKKINEMTDILKRAGYPEDKRSNILFDIKDQYEKGKIEFKHSNDITFDVKSILKKHKVKYPQIKDYIWSLPEDLAY